MRSAKTLVAFLIVAVSISAAFAQQETPAMPTASTGIFKGKLTFTQGGRRLVDYDYTVEVFPANGQTGKISIKAVSDFYTAKEIKRSNCGPTESTSSAFTFLCTGKNGVKENFEINGSSLKGSGVNSNNRPYFMSGMKVTKTSE